MEKNHKYLQDKYFALALEKRMKPQRDLYNQSKEMINRKAATDIEKIFRRKNQLSIDKASPCRINEDKHQRDMIASLNKETSIVKNGQGTNNGIVSSPSLPLLQDKLYIKHKELLNSPSEDAKMKEINNIITKMMEEFK